MKHFLRTWLTAPLTLLLLLVAVPEILLAAKIAEIGGINYSLSEDYTADVVAKTPKYFGDIIIPASVEYEGNTYSVKAIGDDAFSRCGSLISISLPDGLTTIGRRAFEGCEYLGRVSFPEGLISIGDDAFRSCETLTTVSFPEGLISIGEYAFRDCEALTTVSFPDGLTTIGKGTFQFCHSLASVSLPMGLNTIEDSVFENCFSLSQVTFPEGITTIGTYAFNECYALTSVSLPEGLTSIGSAAFGLCTKLKTLVIPSTVESIGYGAWWGCKNIEEITYITESPIDVPNQIFSEEIYDRIKESGKFHYNKRKIELYLNTEPWCHFIDPNVGIEEIKSNLEDESKFEVFDLQGVCCGNAIEGLPRGIYVVRSGSKTSKIRL